MKNISLTDLCSSHQNRVCLHFTGENISVQLEPQDIVAVDIQPLGEQKWIPLGGVSIINPFPVHALLSVKQNIVSIHPVTLSESTPCNRLTIQRPGQATTETLCVGLNTTAIQSLPPISYAISKTIHEQGERSYIASVLAISAAQPIPLT